MKMHELLPDFNFKLIDASPIVPHDQETIMKAMAELHKRVHYQADNYGAEVDKKTGKMDASKHKLYKAVISHP